MSDYINQNVTINNYDTKEIWTILTPAEQSIKEKIEQYGTPLKDWDINIYRGILTGYNDEFIIDGHTKDRLLKEDSKSAKIIRPILRGRDIKRYSYEFADLWLICTHNGTATQARVDINKYSAIKKHLDKFYDKLEKRCDKGDTPYNLRSCAYMDDFNKQKILYPCIMANEPSFILDNNKEFYTIAPGNIITGNNLKYLLALLNSKTYYFALRKYYMGGGIEGELKTNRLLLLPLPLPNSKLEPLIIKQVDILLASKINILPLNCVALKKIDDIIADFLGLTEEEKELMNSI